MSRTFQQDAGVARYVDGVVHDYKYYRTAPDESDQLTHCGMWVTEETFTWLPEGEATCLVCVVRGAEPLRQYFKNRLFAVMYGAGPKKLGELFRP